MKQRLGLHLRIEDSLLQTTLLAMRLQLPFFQCFFVSQKTGKYITIGTPDYKEYVYFRNQYFSRLYAHATYWINIANPLYNAQKILLSEIELAKRFEFTHLILHPGSAPRDVDRLVGIETIARTLNLVLKSEKQIQLVLENTAHGNNSIGSDIADFTLLLSKLDFPDRIHFCIDTAHAYAYGYDLVDDQLQDQFIELLESNLSLERIALIHFNDTKELLASKKDQHEIIGKGQIGKTPLTRFALHSKLNKIPLLMEFPPLSEQEQLIILNGLRNI